MTFVKVVLKYGFGEKTTYIDYKNSNFEDFKKQFTAAFPILERSSTYRMYWVDNSYGGRFAVKTGHYFHRYVANGASRRLVSSGSSDGETGAHYLLIELDDNAALNLPPAANVNNNSVPATAGSLDSGTPLTVAIHPNVPLNFKRLLAILNCITDDKWLDIAKYSSSAYGSDNNRVQHGIRCDGCRSDITGVRYKCVQCKEYNLCTVCSVFRQMHTEHIMFKLCETNSAINSRLQQNFELNKVNGFDGIEQLLREESKGDTDILSKFTERLALFLRPISIGGAGASSERPTCIRPEPAPSTSKNARDNNCIDSKFLEKIRSSIEHVTIKEPDTMGHSDDSSGSDDWTFVTHSGEVKNRESPSNEVPMTFRTEDYSRIARNVQIRLDGEPIAASSIPTNFVRHVDEVLVTMLATQLLKSVDGDIRKAVEMLKSQKRSASTVVSQDAHKKTKLN